MRHLAAAFNDRLKLGPSLPWRVIFYWLGLFKQIRNPDESGFLFPSQAEFFEFYQAVRPEDGEWPIAPPGLPEGINVASQIGAFVFGVESINLLDEADRVSDADLGGLIFNPGGSTPTELWNLGKYQRGAIDPDTGAFASPALSVAASHTRFRYGSYSPHGLSWGDFLAGPAVTGTCSSGQDPEPLDVQIKFSKLDGSSTVTYGTCPENSGDLAGVAYSPFAYVLFFNSGAVTSLSLLEWIEGPYESNPTLTKRQNNALDRVLNKFVSEFRGGTAEDQVTLNNRQAFDFQKFLSSQYLLAPQRGIQSNDSFTDVYPQFTLPELSSEYAIPAGTSLTVTKPVGGGTTYPIASGFVCASAYLEAHKLASDVQIEILKDDVVLDRVTLSPDENGDATAISVFKSPTSGGNITVKTSSLGVWRENETPRILGVEITELYEYKPNVHDLYLAMRVGGVKFTGSTDGIGVTESRANEITNRYFQKGCLTNLDGHVALPGSFAEINTNAIFDVARRFSKCVRILNRNNFTGYEVSGGKSKLYFTRYAGGGTERDLWEGIAPGKDAVTTINPGYTYICRNGPVNYGGQFFSQGQTFTGVADFSDYSGAGVYEYEGIRQTAPPQGMSNRWLLGLELKRYHTSNSSIWKADAYSDYYPLVNRCLLCDKGIASNDRLTGHMNYGVRSVSPLYVLSPEAPDSYNYVPVTPNSYAYNHANEITCAPMDTACEEARADFYSSCRLFEPWPEIESVTDDGTGEICVTLSGRVHYHPDAPATIGRDVSGWTVADVTAEDYRTWENGLRQYLIWKHLGSNANVKTGDESGNSGCTAFTDVAFGACFPHFLLVSLVNEPYQDGNATYQPSDTPFWHDEMAKAELYLRAMCEGFVDGTTSAANACDLATTDAFGYTFEELCNQAFDSQWISPLASETTDYLKAKDISAAKPRGHGVLPNTYPSAEVFNRFSAAVNLLDTFRCMLPATLQVQTSVTTTDQDVTTNNKLKNAEGTTYPDNDITFATNDFSLWTTGSPTGSGSTVDSGWSDGSFASVNASRTIVASRGPLAFTLRKTVSEVQWRWNLDTDFENALPDEFSGMLATNAGVIAEVVRIETTYGFNKVSGEFNGTQCHQTGLPVTDNNWNDGNSQALVFTETELENSTTCQRLGGGGESTGEPPDGVAYLADSDPDVNTSNDCGNGPNISLGLTVYNVDTPLIVVALEDGD